MTDKSENRPSVYYIPENFGSDSKVFGGRIRVRYLIDAVLLGLLLFTLIGLPLCLFLMNGQSVGNKLTLCLCVMAPGIVAGILGYNGDPVSTFLLNLLSWRQNSETRLYNGKPVPMGTDPIRLTIENNARLDKLVELWRKREQNRYEKKQNERLEEGETFRFDHDPREAFQEESGDFEEGELAAEPPTNITLYTSADDFDESMKALMRLFGEDEEVNETCQN